MQKQISIKTGIEGLTINAPADFDKISAMSDDEVKKLDTVLSYYRKLGIQENIYGKDHWKNPFEVLVEKEDKDLLCKAINFFLADDPIVDRLTSNFYYVTTRGYQA